MQRDRYRQRLWAAIKELEEERPSKAAFARELKISRGYWSDLWRRGNVPPRDTLVGLLQMSRSLENLAKDALLEQCLFGPRGSEGNVGFSIAPSTGENPDVPWDVGIFE